MISGAEHERLRKYLLSFIVTYPSKINEIKDSKFFAQHEIEMLKTQRIDDKYVCLSKIAQQVNWIIPDSARQQRSIRFKDLQRKLISCMGSKQIRKQLVELAEFNPQIPLWTINKNWSIPTEIRIVVLNLKRGFLQDFFYILLGKVNELVQRKDFPAALSLLTDLKVESKRLDQSNDNKLGKLVDWEKLNVQILHRLDSYWPKKPPTKKDPWITQFKTMVVSMNNEAPRIEIVENALFMMLNLNDWSVVVPDNKMSLIVELCATFSNTMIEVQQDSKNKNPLPRKRAFWDLVLPIFNLSNQQQQNSVPKRNHRNRRSSDSPGRFSSTSMNISIFKQFLDKLRDPFVITILLSMLSKMHNLLKDDSNMELYIEHFHFWPASISNVNAYNVKSLAETLSQLLKQGLIMYPLNIPWIKLQGDLEFVHGNNEAAMKYYVQSIIIATDYCSLPIQRPVIDENIIKKMIKCSSNLGCFLQSAILCQFTEEIDYTIAFKCLQEKTSNFHDAMVSYIK